MEPVQLLDERSHPDVRAVYGRLAAEAGELDAAVGRVRLGGMTLEEGELGSLSRIRLLMGEMNALTLSSEAEAMAADPLRTGRIRFLAGLLEEGRLEVRISPMAGWNPDFSIFTRRSGAAGRETPSNREDEPAESGATLLVGPHWFVRPYPHPGPAFVVILGGAPALMARNRFMEAWDRGHDVRTPLVSLIARALRRAAPPPPRRLTLRDGIGYSLQDAGPARRNDPV